MFAALEDGRSRSVSPGGGSPISLRPIADAADPLKAIAAKVGEIVQQMLDPVVLGFANGLVEAAAPGCRRDHVPKADAPVCQPLQPRLVIEAMKLLADRTPKQPPELVRRMRIIASRRQ